LSPTINVSCAEISPSTWPSILTVPSNTSLPVTRLPLPRNALVPPASSMGAGEGLSRSRSDISTSRGPGSAATGTPSLPDGRGRSLRSRSFPNSAIGILPGCLGPGPDGRGGQLAPKTAGLYHPVANQVKVPQDPGSTPDVGDRSAGRARHQSRTRSR